MRNFYLYGVLLLLWSCNIFATEWHVTVNGTPTGNGTLTAPWDIQTALNHPASVKPGDTIWLHQGDYKGRFVSRLNGTSGMDITVSSYPGELAVLDGEKPSLIPQTLDISAESDSQLAVLNVIGGFVIFENFEITRKGANLRNTNSAGMQIIGGINHLSGENCKFRNLVIYNTTGTGVGSWKSTAGSEFYGNIVYNNGWIASDRAHGPGFYVQNKSDQIRLIENNIIFNNYYKGIDVWSANTNTASLLVRDYVKNVTLHRNVIFNSSTPSPYRPAAGIPLHNDNIMIGTDDNAGFNIARKIIISDNFLYHTTNLDVSGTWYDGTSLTIGWNPGVPVQEVTVNNNFIVGRNPVVFFNHAKTLTFTNNIVWGRYIMVSAQNSNDIGNWVFDNNRYATIFNEHNDPDYRGIFLNSPNPKKTLNEWKAAYNIDLNSTWTRGCVGFGNKQLPVFDTKLTKITQNKYAPNKFTVVLFDKSGSNKTVDFTNYTIPTGTAYKIRDVENYHTIVTEGIYNGSISFDMESTQIELPTVGEEITNNYLSSYAVKSANNFGTYIVEFETCNIPSDLVISNQTFTNVNTIAATNSITFGANFKNEVNANTTAKASNSISLLPGVSIVSNSQFLAKIEPVLCSGVFLPYVGESTDPQRGTIIESQPTVPSIDVTKSISVYPNPTYGLFMVQLNNLPSGTLEVVDMMGVTVYSTTFNNQSEIEVDIQNSLKGIYVIRVTSENQVYTSNLIKE